MGEEPAEGGRARRNGRTSCHLGARRKGAAAGESNGTRANTGPPEKPAPAVAQAGVRFVEGVHCPKACLRSYFATLRPSATPATTEPREWKPIHTRASTISRSRLLTFSKRRERVR